MLKAVIGKHSVELSWDGNYLADIWGDKVELDIKPSGRPMLTVSNTLNGWLSFVHPDEIEERREK